MTKRVLLVEDDEDNLASLSDLLLEGGFEVVTARSGREAHARLDDGPLGLVLIDYLLPDMTGRDVLRMVRLDGRHHGVPVVVLTAAPEAVVGALEAPVVKKPVTVEDLLAILARHPSDEPLAPHLEPPTP